MPYLVSYHVPIWRVHHSKTNRPMDPILQEAHSLYSQPTLASLTFVKGRLWSAPEAMRCEQGVFFLQYSMFACAHLGGSACGLPKRAKWSTYVESKVFGVESLCLEGLVNYSIQAEDIIIYLCSFQGTFACFFRQICCFLPVMMSSGDCVSQRCAPLTS